LQFAAPFYEQDVYFRSTDNDGKKEWNKLWHTNNVGPNSGLDADLLDGKHADDFSLATHKHDDRYLKLSGGALTGDVNFANDQQGIVWNRNSNGASIKFYNTSDIDNSSRLEFQTRDNRNEYFIFTHKPSNDSLIDLLKISNTELSYKADKIWHAGNDGSTSGLDADLLDGKEASDFSLTGHLHDDRYRKFTSKIGINDLTTGAPQWQSDGVLQSLGSIFVSHAAPSNGIYTRNVYGRSESGLSGIADKSLRLFGGNAIGASIELFDPSHASAADAIRIKSNSTTGIYASNKLSLEVKDNGHVVAPQQTQAFITSNNKSLTTKEYVTAEIAKVFPDNHYVKRIDPQFESGVIIHGSKSPDLSLADNGRTVPRSAYADDATNLWLKGNSAGVSGIFFESSKDGTRVNSNSDGAFIQYRAHGIGNTSGEQSDLVIGITNDSTASAGDKIVFNTPGKDQLVITYDAGDTEHKIWHAGNDGTSSGLDADKLDGNHADVFALKSGTAFTGDSTIAQGKTLRFIHGNASNGNDGTISAGKYGSGLNIVGTKTVVGGSRQVRIWGDLITDAGNKYWHAGNDGDKSGLDADKLDGYHASDFAKPNTKISVLSPTADSHAATKKYVDNKTASLTDASTLDGIDSLKFINNTASSNVLKSNLTPGWYTIAVNTGSRAVARFGLKDQRSSRHQSIVFYASHSYGKDDSNNITVLHSSSYNQNLPFKNIRIKEGSTYDGAALQIFISNSSNSVQAFLLGDNFQTSGWLLRDWVPDSQNPNIGYSYPDPKEAQRSYSGYYSGMNNSTFNSTTAWSVDVKSNVPNEYVQLDLLQNQLFAGLQTRGRGDGQQQWVTKYKVAYSTDNITYTYINNGQVFTGNSDANTSYQNIFPRVTARYVRVYPVEYFSHPSMRLRLVIDAWNVVTNVAGEVDLSVSNGGIITTDEVYAGGQTTQNKLWHDGNTTNAVVNTTIKNGSVSANKLSEGAPSWDTSKNLFVNGKLRLGKPVLGTTPYTEIYAERTGKEDILTVYANDKIVFQNGDRIPTMTLDHDGNKVIIGSDTILSEQGKLHIDSGAVPLSFRETDQTGVGSFWRMPLDGKSLRFDSSNDGTTFGAAGYTNVFQMYDDGRVRAPNLTKSLINTNRSLVTKEYVAGVESSLEDKFADHNHTGAQAITGRPLWNHPTSSKHFVSTFTSTSTSDGGGILIDVTDNNNDEHAISVYNTHAKIDKPIFVVKATNGDTDVGGKLEVAGSITSKTSIAIPNVLDISSTAISYKTNKIWHEGNDGSGSGLNADLLDGYHASDFAKPYTNILINRPTQDYHAATKEYVDGVAKAEVVGVLESVYPIGSVYTNINSTNPNTLFGFGTWQTFGAGRVLVGVNSSDSTLNASQKTGGTKTHTLTIDQMPSHNHSLKGNNRGTSSRQKYAAGLYKDDAETVASDPNSILSTGGGAAHNNMQPYVTVYMWLRTA
jgi:hypothetical protein